MQWCVFHITQDYSGVDIARYCMYFISMSWVKNEEIKKECLQFFNLPSGNINHYEYFLPDRFHAIKTVFVSIPIVWNDFIIFISLCQTSHHFGFAWNPTCSTFVKTLWSLFKCFGLAFEVTIPLDIKLHPFHFVTLCLWRKVTNILSVIVY